MVCFNERDHPVKAAKTSAVHAGALDGAHRVLQEKTCLKALKAERKSGQSGFLAATSTRSSLAPGTFGS